jgi:hypothetical protein
MDVNALDANVLVQIEILGAVGTPPLDNARQQVVCV